MKNRQPRSAYSLDENISSIEPSTPPDESIIHLKPILKKKSWSIEETVPSRATNSYYANECVKGILKSNDKLTETSLMSSSSLLLKSSAIEDFSYSTSNSVQEIFNASPVKTTLKGILKSTSKNCHSSISSYNSLESIVDVPDIDRFSQFYKSENIAFEGFSSEGESTKVASLISDKGVASNDGFFLENSNNSEEVEKAFTSSMMKPILKKTNLPANNYTQSSSSSFSSINSLSLNESDSSSSEHGLSSNLIFSNLSSPKRSMITESYPEIVSSVFPVDTSDNKPNDGPR